MEISTIKQRVAKLVNPVREFFSHGINLSEKIEAVIIVDVSSVLTLIDVRLKNTIEVRALKAYEWGDDKKDETILNALRDFTKDNRASPKNAILRLDIASLAIKRLALPAMPEKELRGALGLQLKEDISFDFKNAVFDFSIIKKTKKDDGSYVLDIICALADAGEIAPYAAALQKAGLSCVSLGLLPFGYAKLAEKRMIAGGVNAFGIVHLAYDSCFLVFFEDTKLVFYRELPLSQKKLTEALSTPLISEKGALTLSAGDINEVLTTIGVPARLEAGGPAKEEIYKEKVSSSQVFFVLRPHLERLAEEIRRSRSYYETQLGGGKIQALFLAGKASAIPNLAAFVKSELSLAVENISLLPTAITVADGVRSVDLGAHYAALGTSIDFKGSINVLPCEFRSDAIETVQKVSLRWVAFLSLLLLAVFFFFARVEVGNYQKRLSNEQLLLHMLSQVNDVKTKNDELRAFISTTRGAEPPFGTLLKMLSSVSSERLFLTKLDFDAAAKTGDVTGFIKADNQNPDVLLAEFIRRLENSDFFADADIVSVERKKQEGEERAYFVLKVTLP